MRLLMLAAVLIASPALANDHNLLGPTRHDLVATPTVREIRIVPPQPTELTPEVANKYFPAPASADQLVKLQAGTTVTRTRTVTRTTTANYAQPLVLRAQPVRRLFGLFRGRFGRVLGMCSY